MAKREKNSDAVEVSFTARPVMEAAFEAHTAATTSRVLYDDGIITKDAMEAAIAACVERLGEKFQLDALEVDRTLRSARMAARLITVS